jgi:transposase
VERVAALDVGKAMLVACARVPHDAKPGRRRQEVRSFATTTRSLLALADWLYGLGATRVVMESTSTYWKSLFYLLEEAKHVPGRLEALIAGQRDPKVLVQLAQGRMRAKLSVLAEALTGHFRAHHSWLLRMMLDRIDALGGQIDRLTGRIEALLAPFAHQVAQLDAIPGVGRIDAQELTAEIGIEMSRFPSAGHLVSWAKFAPTTKASAGKT